MRDAHPIIRSEWTIRPPSLGLAASLRKVSSLDWRTSEALDPPTSTWILRLADTSLQGEVLVHLQSIVQRCEGSWYASNRESSFAIQVSSAPCTRRILVTDQPYSTPRSGTNQHVQERVVHDAKNRDPISGQANRCGYHWIAVYLEHMRRGQSWKSKCFHEIGCPVYRTLMSFATSGRSTMLLTRLMNQQA